jgi:hypothetical protein
MPKASEVAAELRKFADCLDKEPDTEIDKPFVYFIHYSKKPFISLARLMPRPFKKGKEEYGSDPRIRIVYENASIDITSTIPQSSTCTLVKPAQPAIYDCDPILSLEEDAQLTR